MIRTNTISCDLCGSTEHRFLSDGRDRLHGNEGIFSYVICSQCGLVYMNPQIAVEDIGQYYPREYSPYQSDSKPPGKSNCCLGSRTKKSQRMTLVRDKLEGEKKLLDIGCGNGKFLSEMRTLTGCEIYGVDLSELAVESAKRNFDLDIFHGEIGEIPIGDDYFNVITAWEYLEHVHKPMAVLGKIHDLLKPQGDFIISCPNFDGLNAKIFGSKWYHLDCPRHLHLYTPKTITRLLEKSGFTVTNILHNSSSKSILGSLQYLFYADNVNPIYRNRIRKSALIKALVSPISRFSALVKKSDSMTVLAKRNGMVAQ